ncbi:helix-turn-helix transcriptional regulator [Myxococcaceae bacterium GXIMD 01537]
MYEQLAIHIGQTARAARQRRGLSQEQVAEALLIPTLAYARLERGKLLPSVPTLCLLAEVLGLSADALMGRTPVDRATAAERPASGPSDAKPRRSARKSDSFKH